MSISDLRSAVATAGGTPTAYDEVNLLRQLITAWGGTPTQWSVNGLLKEAITKAGGTPTQNSYTGLLRELVTALGGTPATYQPDALYAQAAARASLYPYGNYALALDFKNGIYGTSAKAASLSAISGYAFTDNVDNQPNIVAGSGFTSLTAELSNLRTTANPATTDQDFIAWVVANWIATSSGVQLLLNLGGTTANRISIYRDGTNVFTVNAVGGTGGAQTTTAGASGGGATGRGAILYRRRSGKDTIAIKATNGSVGVGTESAATTFASPSSALQAGVYVDGTLQPNATIEFVGIRLGTFTDADLTTILTAA